MEVNDMTAFEIEQETPQPTCIKVIGIGGGGCNTVSDMFNMNIENVEFFALNTDVQSLKICQCPNMLQIGKELTNGLGAGSDPHVGEEAALSAKDDIVGILEGADMVFIATGLGGGTGTGAAPVVAQIARDMDILTVAVITRPFRFEGPQRAKRAEEGLEKLRQICDTLLVISNDRLLEVVGNKSELLEAFHIANNVLAQGVKSISELITQPGHINVDFSDVRTVMGISGGAVMGVGVGKGENRAVEAVKKACSNPLLDKIVIQGAKGILICITGPQDLSLQEINEATTLVYDAADDDANIIFGTAVTENLKDEVKVTLIATGFQEDMPEASAFNQQPIVNMEPASSRRKKRTISTAQEKPQPEPENDKKKHKKESDVNPAATPRIEIEPDIFAEDDDQEETDADEEPEHDEVEVKEEKEEVETVAQLKDDDGDNGRKEQHDDESNYDIPAIFRRRRLIF